MRLGLRGFVAMSGGPARIDAEARAPQREAARCGSSGNQIITPAADDGNEFVIATSGSDARGRVAITFNAQGKVTGD
jgi:hypothetical protein